MMQETGQAATFESFEILNVNRIEPMGSGSAPEAVESHEIPGYSAGFIECGATPMSKVESFRRPQIP
jgi:hypothetical protein